MNFTNNTRVTWNFFLVSIYSGISAVSDPESSNVQSPFKIYQLSDHSLIGDVDCQFWDYRDSSLWIAILKWGVQ